LYGQKERKRIPLYSRLSGGEWERISSAVKSCHDLFEAPSWESLL
jgi:hypothetical protein